MNREKLWDQKIRPHLPLIGILLLAAALRLPLLDQVPKGFYRDEAAIGYDAYSILKTGRDHWGDFFPLFTRSLGDYDEATHRYLVVPFVWLLGLNEFSTRLPSALIGILTVWALYDFARQLFNKKIALIIALFLAISPWHIVFSRWAVRAILLPLGFCLALSTFFRGLKNPKYFLLSAICFALCLHTYNSARVFIPLFLCGLFILYRKPLWQLRQWVLPASLIFIILFGYLFTFWVSPQGMRRAQATLSVNWTTIPSQYLSYLNPYFLFWRGDDNPRHSLLPMGQLHHIEFFTILLGLYGLLSNRGPHRNLIRLWLLLYPIPAALTASTHAIRSIIGTPLFAILSGYGAYTLYRWFQSRQQTRIFVMVSVTILAISIGFFSQFYFFQYPNTTARWWQYGIGKAFQKAEELPYPCIIDPLEPYAPYYIFNLFYSQFSPSTYHQLPVKHKEQNWSQSKLGKYQLARDFKTSDIPASPQLYFAGPQLYNTLMQSSYQVFEIDVIENPNGDGVWLQVLLTTGEKFQ